MIGTWVIIVGVALWLLGIVINGAHLAGCLLVLGSGLIVWGANVSHAMKDGDKD